MLNKILGALTLITLLTSCSPSDSKIRSSVVKLSSAHGSCSGTQIQAPSGEKFILTAAHCMPVSEDGKTMHVSTEDGGSYYSKILEESTTSDLLLLEPAPGIPAVKIAKDLSRFDELRAFTHGHGYPTYKSTGVYIGEDIASALISEINSPEDEAKCKAMPKNSVESIDFFGLKFSVCILSVSESVTTVNVAPGSSGGLVANSDGELMGVVSMGSPEYSYLVTLKDINSFLSKR